MTLTKTTPAKKTAARQPAEKPVLAKPATTTKAASRTATSRQIHIADSTMASLGLFEVPVSPEVRQHMIREAAYFHAVGRAFTEGDPVRDWQEAEMEIDRMLREQQDRI